MKRRKFNPAAKLAGRATFGPDGQPKPQVVKAIERAVEVQRPLVLANIRRMQRKNPSANAAELIRVLDRHYLNAVTGGGAAIGATAVVPGVGTVASLGLSAAATVGFLEATALYAQSVAELHGVRLADPEKSRTMVMAVMLGEEGTSMMQQLAGRGAAKSWGSSLGNLPSGLMGSIRRQFLKRFVARQGTAMLGRALPLGVGAVVGGIGNHAMGKGVIKATRAAFGEPPTSIPGELAGELDQIGKSA
ncbi:hypothetical protein GD627_00405 [Arthrobacter yangruifuii]|uniref:Di-and tripeptidase n=1 Tax=Arthrobacter yangruifuii TaxID=2606616 RepID=A0A5N6MS70_9MICC|nr:hypothetical protein [Arthrobacter yangruifuii]KAD4059610.1 hypothetical protein GD627_00405 [Arthrobacter yangruifuii]